MNTRGNARLLALLTAVLLATAACGTDSDDKADAKPTSASSATDAATEGVEATEAVVEEPTEATPEQLASVIAGYEKDWRQVIKNAGDCRWDWTVADDPTAEIRGMTCYMRETTISYTTETAAAEMAELTPPSSMAALVDETNTALAAVYDIDLEGVCGDPVVGPNDTKKCSTTLGERMWAYSQLETALDQWSPYL